MKKIELYIKMNCNFVIIVVVGSRGYGWWWLLW